MKKLLALLLCAMLAFTALCACESDKKSRDDDDDDDESVESSEVSNDSSDVSDDESTDVSDEASSDVSNDVSTDVSNDVSDTTSQPEQSDLSIVGTWEAEFDIASMLFGGETDSSIPCIITMTFTETEATVKMELTQTAEELADVMLKISYEIAGGETVMSYDEFLAVVDRDEMVASAQEMIDSSSETSTSEYTLVGNQLTLDDSVCTIAINGNQLTFTDIQASGEGEADEETIAMLESMTFTKVA